MSNKIDTGPLDDVQTICTDIGLLTKTDTYEGVTKDACALQGKFNTNADVFTYAPYEKNPVRGLCQLYQGQPKLYKPDSDSTCNTYLFNRQPSNKLFDSKAKNITQPDSIRTFEIQDPSKGLSDCKNACINPYSSDCTHFYVKDNTCHLLYKSSNKDRSLYQFSSSVGISSKETALCPHNQAIIDDVNQCENAGPDIERFLNQHFEGTLEEQTDKHTIQFMGSTPNSNMPYGCNLKANTATNKHELWFNSNKTNTKANGYYNVCTSHPRNKVVLNRFDSNTCDRGERILDEEQCNLLGKTNALYFEGYKGKYNNGKGDPNFPKGCIAVRESDSNFTNLSLYFNTGGDNANKKAAPVCDLYPNIHSGDFKGQDDYTEPVKNVPPGTVLSARYVDSVQNMNLKPSSKDGIVLFSNDTSTACANQQTLLKRTIIKYDELADPSKCLDMCKNDKKCKSFLFTRVSEHDHKYNQKMYSGICDLYSTRCKSNAAVSSKKLEGKGLALGLPDISTKLCPQTMEFGSYKDRTKSQYSDCQENCKSNSKGLENCEGKVQQKGAQCKYIGTKDTTCLGDVVYSRYKPFEVFSNDFDNTKAAPFVYPLYGKLRSSSINRDVTVQNWFSRVVKKSQVQIVNNDIKSKLREIDFNLPSIFPDINPNYEPVSTYNTSSQDWLDTNNINKYQRLRVNAEISLNEARITSAYIDNSQHFKSAKPYVRVNMDR